MIEKNESGGVEKRNWDTRIERGRQGGINNG